MRSLYSDLEQWQNANDKRFLSLNIQQDDGKFCCVALTNPTEVVITDVDGRRHVGLMQAYKDSDLYCLVTKPWGPL